MTELSDKQLQKIQEFKDLEDKKGIVYLSSVPLFMKPEKLRHLMSQFGEVGRVYLQPEDAKDYERRKKQGGNKAMKYIDGWVEFSDKKIAKSVAESLNSTPIGGKKRHNFWHDDIWNIKYLPKFKWSNLTEYAFYKRSLRTERMVAQLAQQKREHNFMLANVEKKKRKEDYKEYKKRLAAEEGTSEAPVVAEVVPKERVKKSSMKKLKKTVTEN